MAAMQRNLTDLSEGLDYCLWFSLGEGPGGTYGNSKTALFDEFLLAKPGYAAYKLLAYILQDMTSVERGAGNAFTINRQDRPPLIVAWAEDGQAMGLLNLPAEVTGTIMRITDPITGAYQQESLLGANSLFLYNWPVVVGELP